MKCHNNRKTYFLKTRVFFYLLNRRRCHKMSQLKYSQHTHTCNLKCQQKNTVVLFEYIAVQTLYNGHVCQIQISFKPLVRLGWFDRLTTKRNEMPPATLPSPPKSGWGAFVRRNATVTLLLRPPPFIPSGALNSVRRHAGWTPPLPFYSVSLVIRLQLL